MKDLENTIKYLMKQWAEKKLEEQFDSDKVQYSGPVLGPDEYENMMDAIFNNWWSGGKYTVETEKKLAEMSMRNHGLLYNSGSSANLVLMSAAKDLYFKDGDKILTLACGFPTTVNPIIQNNLKPVFVDISLDNFGLDPTLFEKAVKKDPDIRGAFIPHHLGFPNQIDELIQVARKYGILLFFDCCDSYGSTYKGNPLAQYGKASTFSFYVAHHLTMGEGGGLVTNDNNLFLTSRGMRNWGRYCSSDNCCVRSVDPSLFCSGAKLTQNSDLPDDYIVNYQYEWMGYNLKPLDLQSAILSKQLDKLESFNTARIRNYNMLFDYMKTNTFGINLWKLKDGVSPFAFPMLLSENSGFERKHLINFLKQNKIESRLLFSGNLTKHPAYTKNKDKWEVFGDLKNSDIITDRFIMLGVSQAIPKIKMEKTINTLETFFEGW